MNRILVMMNIVIALLAAYLNLWSPGESLALQKVMVLDSSLGHEIGHLLRFSKNFSVTISLAALVMAVVHFKAKALALPKGWRLTNLILNGVCTLSILFWAF